MPISNPPRMFYGADYNPEQWPEALWQEDMRLMRETGVNMVSLGIFSWAKLEPSPGQYDFGWMDKVMDLLAQNGIACDLATPTASPPPWLAHRYPDSLPMDNSGRRLWPGSRQHYCPNSQDYRRHAAGITREVVKRYASHSALTAWHINNEYACHTHSCYCDNCATAFRNWLRARYSTLEGLNTAWGTTFWSQRYGHWDEIQPPRQSPTFSNPTQRLDYKRFMNASLLSLMLAEKAIVKESTPHLPATTNFMGFWEHLDYFEWAQHLDFCSWDSYPDPNEGVDGASFNAMSHDLTRSFRHGQPFVLMEQVTSQVNWRDVNSLRRPGEMRAMSLQAVARGADGVMFFQWRQSKAGAEKYHGALVQHVGPRGRVFEEVKTLGAELAGLSGVVDGRVPARAAIVVDWQSRWALEQESKPARFNMYSIAPFFHRPFYDANIPVDFVTPEGDWSGYEVVVAPTLYMMTDAAASNIRGFVQRGGTFLASWFTGIVDENEHIRLGGYPGAIRDVLGMYVEEWDPLPGGKSNAMRFSDGAEVPCDTWCEVVHTEGAETLATYAQDFYAGRPALTRHAFGKGRAYYLSTRPDCHWLATFLRVICADKGIKPLIDTPLGVEASLREKDGRRYLFLINHNSEAVEFSLGALHGQDLLAKRPAKDQLNLAAEGVAIIELQTT